MAAMELLRSLAPVDHMQQGYSSYYSLLSQEVGPCLDAVRMDHLDIAGIMQMRQMQAKSHLMSAWAQHRLWSKLWLHMP